MHGTIILCTRFFHLEQRRLHLFNVHIKIKRNDGNCASTVIIFHCSASDSHEIVTSEEANDPNNFTYTQVTCHVRDGNNQITYPYSPSHAKMCLLTNGRLRSDDKRRKKRCKHEKFPIVIMRSQNGTNRTEIT